MTKPVWIVEQYTDWEGGTILGVFSSEDKAQAYAEKYARDNEMKRQAPDLWRVGCETVGWQKYEVDADE